jgi:hypothetical protein
MAVENGNWGLDGVTDSYHTLSHHGQREESLSQLAIIEKHLMTNLARFVERLKTTMQPGGSTWRPHQQSSSVTSEAKQTREVSGGS